MGDRKIGIRELTSTPSECVRQVKRQDTRGYRAWPSRGAHHS